MTAKKCGDFRLCPQKWWEQRSCLQKGVGIHFPAACRKGLFEIFMDADVHNPSMGATTALDLYQLLQMKM
jgi:hypothetical protein